LCQKKSVAGLLFLGFLAPDLELLVILSNPFAILPQVAENKTPQFMDAAGEFVMYAVV
jgi:hypothetical protein